MVPIRKTNNVLAFLLALSLLASTPTAAKSFGGGSKTGGGSSFGGSSYGGSKTSYGSGSSTGSFGGGMGKTSGGTYGPMKTNGGGYANRNAFSGAGYSRYPNYGYSPFFYSGFFLYSGHHRPNRYRDQNKYKNRTSEDDFNFEDFFERVENGCQVVGVESYRTIDNNNNSNSTWTGCSEEWHYNVEFVGNSTFTPADVDPGIDAFVSPPLEFYACDVGDSCAACKDELRGDNFDALTLEEFDFGNKTYLLDCYVPKNHTLVNETFDCTNEECVFLSEKYDYMSSSPSILAGSTMYWTMLLSSGIAVSMYSLLA
eukprot:CAMPEP_0168196754 /NCGR_PEP_ID=MMETSP0139_2-20121125/20718_1 /TAXON_ID=44445 /ORGANISM="Pseudo-nitzschia australis, Strain 10249 10 AB" /LENGTH=312 /DNA_ID=CAMNT_0008121017 /DNA_START=244 /DNA_END=1182 /DNA_ORIENTATION=-